jgi:MFS family permease
MVAVLIATTVFGARPLISYRALSLDATAGEIGLIASSFAVFALVGAIPVGRATDRIGGRPIVVAGALACALACGLLGFAASLPLLAAAQAGLGIGQLMVVVGSQTILTRSGATAGQAGRVGLYTSAASLGHALGPALGTLAAGDALAAGTGTAIFAAGSMLALLAAAISLALPSSRPGIEGRRATASTGVRSLLVLPGMRTAILTSVVVLASVDILIAFLPVYGTERSIPPATIGLIIGALSASQIASRLVIGRLVGRWGHRIVLVASMAAPAAVVPVMLLPLAPVALLATTTVVGLAMGLAQPMSLILVAASSPPTSRGLAMSLRLVGNRLGQLTIPAFVGAVAGASGVGAVFVSVAALLGVGAASAAADRRLVDPASVDDRDPSRGVGE